MFIILLIALVAAQHWKEQGMCLDESVAQSPIQLKPPFSHIDLELQFEFLEARDIYMKNTGHELVVQGTFGFVKHNGRLFNAYQVKFKSPSEHSMSENDYFYPMEMQIFLMSQDKYRIAFSVLFQLSKDHVENPMLANFGFGKDIIKELKLGDIYLVPTPLNLGQLFTDSDKFIVYQGSDTYPPCEQMIWLVLFKFYTLSTKQAVDFPELLLYQVRETKANKRPIYANFDPILFVITDEELETKQDLSIQRKHHQVDKKLVKDNFMIVGSKAELDGFLFVPPGQAGGKVIRTEDYFVIKVVPKAKDPQDVQSEGEAENIGQCDGKPEDDQPYSGKFNVEDQPVSGKFSAPEESTIEEDDYHEQTVEYGAQIIPGKHPQAPKLKHQTQEKKINMHNRVKERQASKAEQAKQQTLEKQAVKKEEEEEKRKEEEEDTELKDTPTKIWPRLCKVGRAQSPINIDQKILIKQEFQQPVIEYDIVPKIIFLSFDGFQLKLLSDDIGFGALTWNGKLYQATEINFHTPAEHTLGPNGFRMNCELQIIHRSVESDILILVIFLHNSAETDRSEFLESIGMPAEKSVNYRAVREGELIQINKEIKLKQLLDGEIGEFMAYTGSLTSPPCIENVQYIIRRSRLPVSTVQIENMQRLMGYKQNSRPQQHINGRVIYTN